MSKFLREDKEGKPDFTLIPYGPLKRIALRFGIGARKYSKFNWQEAPDTQTYKESLLRHTLQYINGDTDEDHLSAIAVNSMILMWLEDNGKNKKDTKTKGKGSGLE